jgi:MFS family permease
MNNAPLASILADSLRSGNRTKITTINYALGLLGSSSGPAIACLFFWQFGDDWNLSTLRYCLYTGIGIQLIGCLFLPFFDDSKTLGAESESLVQEDVPVSSKIAESRPQDVGSHVQNFQHSNNVKNVDNTTMLLHNDQMQETLIDAQLAEEMKASEEEFQSQLSKKNLGHQTLNCCCFVLRVSHIPYIIFSSDIIMAIGAGMTVQYFALFFKDDYNLVPFAIAIIYFLNPLMIALFSYLAFPVTRIIGRAVTAVLCDAIGTACIILMSFKFSTYPTIAMFLFRTAAMNAGYPTQRSMLMDVVAKHNRGKWNAAESITSFTWTGSAALGGYLIKYHDYRYTFLITGFIYSLSTLLLALTIPLTAGEVVDVDDEADGEDEDDDTDDEGEDVYDNQHQVQSGKAKRIWSYTESDAGSLEHYDGNVVTPASGNIMISPRSGQNEQSKYKAVASSPYGTNSYSSPSWLKLKESQKLEEQSKYASGKAF